MKIERILLLPALFAILLATAACGAKKKNTVVTRLVIDSVPSEASVHLLGAERGKTQFRCRLNPGTYIVKLTKHGFSPEWVSVNLKRGETKEIKAVLNPVTANVMLESVPSGALVTFRGKTVGTTPLILHDLPFGSYSALLKSPEYAPKNAEWTIDSPRPKQLRVELNSNKGTLYVTSEPSGAAVLLNGKKSGNTPRRIRLEQGTYQVTVKRAGFEPQTVSTGINKNLESKVNIRLVPMPASLFVKTKPEQASITINGREYGVAPVTLNGIAAGKYTVKAEKKGYDPATTVINIAPGQRVPVNLNLAYSLGSVEFVTAPAGVKVFLNDKLMGVTMPDADTPEISKVFRISELKPGKYSLSFFHKRATPSRLRREIIIEKGKNMRLSRNVEMWIANAVFVHRDGSQIIGRLTAELRNGDIQFEPKPGISTIYKKAEIKSITRIKSQE